MAAYDEKDPDELLRQWQQEMAEAEQRDAAERGADLEQRNVIEQGAESEGHAVYPITPFWGMKPVFSSVLLIFVGGYALYQQHQSQLLYPRGGHRTYVTLFSLIILMAIFQLLVSVIRFFGRSELVIEGEFVVIGGRKLYPGEIQCIMVDGYAKPGIAVKPAGRRITPSKLVFRFTEDQEECLEALDKWASKHGIRVMNKRFIRWI